MSPTEVFALAEDFVRRQVNGQWNFELGAPQRDLRRPIEWNVVVRWIPIDGSTLDAEPAIVVVHDLTKSVHFFERWGAENRNAAKSHRPPSF